MSVVEANSYSAKGKYADFLSDEDEFNSYSAGIRKDEDAVVSLETMPDEKFIAEKCNYADFLSDEFYEDEGPIREGREAVVFWDAQDYPIRSGDHELVFQRIKETLRVCPKR